MCWAHNYKFINKNYPLRMRELKSRETSLASLWVKFVFVAATTAVALLTVYLLFIIKKRTTVFYVLYVCLFNQEKNREFFISKYKWKKSDLFYECVPLQLNDFFSLFNHCSRWLLLMLFYFLPLVYLCSTFVQCSFQLLAAHRKQRDRNKDDDLLSFLSFCVSESRRSGHCRK